MSNPTPEEAMDQALTAMGIRDPFAKIAIANLMKDLEENKEKRGPEYDQILMRIGALASKELGFPW